MRFPLHLPPPPPVLRRAPRSLGSALASALTHHRPVPLLTAGSCLSVSQVRVFSPDGSGLLNTGLEMLHSHHNYNNQTHLPNALCNYALFGCVGYSLCLCWNSECRLLKAITVGSTARSKVTLRLALLAFPLSLSISPSLILSLFTISTAQGQVSYSIALVNRYSVGLSFNNIK